MNKQSVKKVLRFLALFTLILMSVTFITSCLSENTGDQDEAGSNLKESETQKLEEVIEEKGSWEKENEEKESEEEIQKTEQVINCIQFRQWFLIQFRHWNLIQFSQ